MLLSCTTTSPSYLRVMCRQGNQEQHTSLLCRAKIQAKQNCQHECKEVGHMHSNLEGQLRSATDGPGHSEFCSRAVPN